MSFCIRGILTIISGNMKVYIKADKEQVVVKWRRRKKQTDDLPPQ